MGELTEVASAKRGVRGCLSEESEDELDDRVRTKGSGRLLLKFDAARLLAQSRKWLAAMLTGHFLVERKDRTVCMGMIYKVYGGNRFGKSSRGRFRRGQKKQKQWKLGREVYKDEEDGNEGRYYKIETSYREKSRRRPRLGGREEAF